MWNRRLALQQVVKPISGSRSEIGTTSTRHFMASLCN